jgi:protein phosphatase 2C family protein 2/3
MSITGPYHENEDRFSIEPILSDESMSYYAVYDGHGGNYVVDYIKENLPKNIASSLKRKYEEHLSSHCENEGTMSDNIADSDLVCALRESFDLTDTNVIKECRKLNDWSGACVCASLLRNNALYLANLGDSTAVKFQYSPTNSSHITQHVVLSTPHKPKAEEKRIETAGGWVSADGYILGVLSCSRAFGDRDMKFYDDFQISKLKAEFEAGQKIRMNQKIITRAPLRACTFPEIPKSNMNLIVSPSPDIEVFPLEPNDALLVIASDGLWDYLPPKRCVGLVHEAYKKRQCLEDVCERLVSAAQQASSCDDITVMVISLDNRRDRRGKEFMEKF